MSEASPIVLTVTGMTCQGCVNSVARIVKRADPAADVAIDLATGRLEATTGASAQALVEAIAAAGYGAQVA
jgi:copper chaperone